MPEIKYKYLREGEDIYGIKKLQDKLLEIVVYLDDFCKRHEITYYLMGGSALGAIRHKGFIPWDDDFDVFMDQPNLLKFENACKTDLDTNRFYYQKQDTKELPYFFSKLRMNNTACIEAVNANRPWMHQGIFIDIMGLNNAAPLGIKRKVQYYSAAILKASALAKTSYDTRSIKKRILVFFSGFIAHGFVKRLLLWNVKKYNQKTSDDVCWIFNRAKYENSYYPTIDFGVPRYVQFEKLELPVPNNVEEYLEIRYGKDYMQLPDEKTKALYQSHAMQWNTDVDYKDLIK